MTFTQQWEMESEALARFYRAVLEAESLWMKLYHFGSVLRRGRRDWLLSRMGRPPLTHNRIVWD